MQLGSPGGYEPLRRYLLARAVANGSAREGDDILITNGCQQALDLLRWRALVRPGDKVALEDPRGLSSLEESVRRHCGRGADRCGPAYDDGVDLASLRR